MSNPAVIVPGEIRTFQTKPIFKALAVALIVADLAGMIYFYFRFPHETGFDLQMVIAFDVAVLGFPLYAACYFYFLTHQELAITADGMTFHQQGKEYPVPWQEVSEFNTEANFYSIAPGWFTCQIMVKTVKGDRFVVSTLWQDFDLIASILDSHIVPLLIPKTWDAVQRGETLSFHGLKMNRSEILRLIHHIPWQDVFAITVSRGFLNFYSGPEEIAASYQIARVSNLRLLCEIAARLAPKAQMPAGMGREALTWEGARYMLFYTYD